MTDPDLSHIDPEAKKAELEQDAEHAKRQAQQKFAELMSAVENDEEIQHDETDFVEVGDARFEVRCEMSGRAMDIMERFANDRKQSPSLKDVVDAAKEQTVLIQSGDTILSQDSEISGFYDMYYEEHGNNVLRVAMDRIFTPALESRQEKVPDSFQGE